MSKKRNKKRYKSSIYVEILKKNPDKLLKKDSANKHRNKINNRDNKENIKIKKNSTVILSTGKKVKVIEKTTWYVYTDDNNKFWHTGRSVLNKNVSIAFVEIDGKPVIT